MLINDGFDDERLTKRLVQFVGCGFINLHRLCIQQIRVKTISSHQFVIWLWVVDDIVAGKAVDAVFLLRQEDVLKVHGTCIQQEKTMRGIDQELAVSCFAYAMRHLEKLPAFFSSGGQVLELGTIEKSQCIRS